MSCLRIVLCSMPQTRVATRAYKLLATLAKAHQLPRKPAGQSTAEAAAVAASRTLSPEFEALVAYVHKELTASLNLALKDLGAVSREGRRGTETEGGRGTQLGGWGIRACSSVVYETLFS